MNQLTSRPFSPRNIAIALVALIATILLLWDWNWMKFLVEARASAALGRPVHLVHFDVRLARQTLLILDGLSIENSPVTGQTNPMLTVNRISVRVDLKSILHGQIYIPEIVIEKPVGTLNRNAAGQANWQFHPAAGSSGATPQIGNIGIYDGTIHVIDAPLKADFNLAIHTDHPAAGHENHVVINATGTYADQPITAHFSGGSILSFRDPTKPYPVELVASNGPTKVNLVGTIQQPMKFAGADVTLELSGTDLALLYPLTGIPLAASPPYDIKGKLDYTASLIHFRQIAGTVGSSDLEGDLSVDPNGERIHVTGDLSSQKVVLADLAGFIGNAPGKADAANLTAPQREKKLQEEASPTLLPDTPINLPKLRAADLDIRYKGVRIDSQSTPLDNFVANVKLENGTLHLMPLSFGVGTGTIVADILLDGRRDMVHAVTDIDFRHVDVRRIMDSTQLFKGVGEIGGRIRIDGSGNSLAQILGQGNGGIKLFMSGGNMSALMVALAGLDTGRAVITALGIPTRADIRCMVADADLQEGVVKTNLLLIDTSEANIIGKGTIDLKHEEVNYQLTTDAKHFSIGAFSAPIDIDGKLKSPSIKPDPTILAERGGAAAILGVLLTPLGALIPTIELGLGKDTDCAKVLTHVEAAAQQTASKGQKQLKH